MYFRVVNFMSRSIFHAATLLDENEAYLIAESILNQEGYHQIEKNGEVVWKKGTGVLTAMHFIKLEFRQNELIITGWVQIGLGSAGFDDMDLTGILGSLPKKSTFKTIQKIREAIR